MKENRSYILLAEDDPDDQAMLLDALSAADLEINVICVRDGKEALEYLHRCRSSFLPSLILMDYNMPILMAPDILEILAADQRYKTISKWVWSTSTREEYVHRCMSRGASGYFFKPNDMAELKTIVDRIAHSLRCHSF
jgi:CheY-like chemotaxis protein